MFLRLSVGVHERVDTEAPDRAACGKRGESLQETKFRRCVTEPEPVGEASCAGKLPQSSVAVAMCRCIRASVNNQQNTRLSAIYLNVYPPSKNIGYTETSHSILLIARKDISL